MARQKNDPASLIPPISRKQTANPPAPENPISGPPKCKCGVQSENTKNAVMWGQSKFPRNSLFIFIYIQFTISISRKGECKMQMRAPPSQFMMVIHLDECRPRWNSFLFNRGARSAPQPQGAETFWNFSFGLFQTQATADPEFPIPGLRKK